MTKEFDIAKWSRKHVVVQEGEEPTKMKFKVKETAGLAPAQNNGGATRGITVIKEGWGSSGYYSREMLARDGPKVFPAGTHMYMNHPSMTEDFDQPERTIEKLAAVTTKDAQMVDGELVTEAQIFEHWQPVINEVADHIGVSIRAYGEAEQGEVDGKKGPIVNSLDEGISVDFVTKAGAGGKVGPLIESAMQQSAHRLVLTEKGVLSEVATPAAKPTKEDQDMGLEEQLSEANDKIRQHEQTIEDKDQKLKEEKDRGDRAEDALTQERARNIVNEALSADPAEGEDALPELPDRAVERVREAATRAKVPLNEDGTVDKDKLVESVHKAVREEAQYLSGASGAGKVTGMGVTESTNGGGGDGVSEKEEAEAEQRLIESFQKRGMSEDAAKLAVRGR